MKHDPGDSWLCCNEHDEYDAKLGSNQNAIFFLGGGGRIT